MRSRPCGMAPVGITEHCSATPLRCLAHDVPVLLRQQAFFRHTCLPTGHTIATATAIINLPKSFR